MKKITSLLPLFALMTFQSLMAQSGITGFQWLPNPFTIYVGDTHHETVLMGNVFHQGNNSIILSDYLQFDTTWTRTYYSPTYSIVGIKMNHDGLNQFTICGLGSDTVSAYPGIIAQIDSTTGQVLWAKTLERGTNSEMDGSIAVQSGGSLAFGEWIDFPSRYLLLVRLDANGDTLWTKSYLAGDGLHAQNIFQDGSDFVVVGDYNAPASDASRVMVMRIDSSGVPLWTKEYPTGRSEWVTGSHQDTNGDLFLAVTSEDTVNNGASQRLLSIDSAGNQRFVTNLQFDVYDETFSLLHWPGNGIFLGGTRSDGTTGAATLTRLSFNGQLIWSKSYMPGGYPEPQALTRIYDWGIYMGIVDENLAIPINLIQMDTSGTMTNPCDNGIETPIAQPYTVTGQALNPQVLRGCAINSFTLTRVSTLAIKELICIEVGIQEVANDALVTIPNPFSTVAEIRLPAEVRQSKLTVEVWDLNGRQVQMAIETTANGVLMHRGDHAAGMYSYRIASQDGWVGSGRFVLE